MLHVFFRVHKDTILALMPRTISDVNLVDTANNSEVYFFRHFVKLFLCFWGELILNFFLCVLVSRVVGGP